METKEFVLIASSLLVVMGVVCIQVGYQGIDTYTNARNLLGHEEFYDVGVFGVVQDGRDLYLNGARLIFIGMLVFIITWVILVCFAFA